MIYRPLFLGSCFLLLAKCWKLPAAKGRMLGAWGWLCPVLLTCPL